jgi:hypothetical protein
MGICVIITGIYQLTSNCFHSRTSPQHDNVEYIMLQNVDDDDQISNETALPIKEVEQI